MNSLRIMAICSCHTSWPIMPCVTLTLNTYEVTLGPLASEISLLNWGKFSLNCTRSVSKSLVDGFRHETCYFPDANQITNCFFFFCNVRHFLSSDILFQSSCHGQCLRAQLHYSGTFWPRQPRFCPQWKTWFPHRSAALLSSHRLGISNFSV